MTVTSIVVTQIAGRTPYLAGNRPEQTTSLWGPLVDARPSDAAAAAHATEDEEHEGDDCDYHEDGPQHGETPSGSVMRDRVTSELTATRRSRPRYA